LPNLLSNLEKQVVLRAVSPGDLWNIAVSRRKADLPGNGLRCQSVQRLSAGAIAVQRMKWRRVY
jgi:hypothetical protein